MPEEIIDIFDENNKPLGISKKKSEALRDGSWHRASHVWIYNSKGQVLMQLRSKSKKTYPNMWDVSAAGHVDAGEDPLTAALRETKEELGLEVKPGDLEFVRIRRRPWDKVGILENEFQYIYLLKSDLNEKSLKLQEEEVQGAKFFDLDALESELKTNGAKFAEGGEYWFGMINEMRKRNTRKVAA